MSRQMQHAAAAMRARPHKLHHSATVKLNQYSEDDEPYNGRHATSKRKRAGVSAAADSHAEQLGTMSFPMLSDDEPSLDTVQTCGVQHTQPSSPSSSSASSASSSSSELVTHSFHRASKHLFALTDESRDRGSAKIAVLTVSLRHPSFAASSSSSSRSTSSSSLSYTSSFKIDGRKSFSNAPFKKYYRRGVHAAWFAEPTSQGATHSTPDTGRVLILLSQRSGRPNGKGFTGLLHDPSLINPKHPLMCLSSNSVEYYVQVFVNLASTTMQGETNTLSDWTEVEVDVSARFDAGEVMLEPVTGHYSADRTIFHAPRRMAVLPPPLQLLAASSSCLPPQQPELMRPESTTSTYSEQSEQSEQSCSPSEQSCSSSSPSDCHSSSDADHMDSSSTPMHESQSDSDAYASDAYVEHHSSASHLGGDESDFGSSVTLPDSDSEEFLPEWQWFDAPATHGHVDEQPKYQQPTVKLEEQQSSMFFPAAESFAPSHFADQLPTEEDMLLALPVMEERAAKRAKLSIEQQLLPAEPLFLAHQDWSVSSPQMLAMHHMQHLNGAPMCSPLPDFAPLFSF